MRNRSVSNCLSSHSVSRLGPMGVCVSPAHGDHSEICTPLSLRTVKRVLLTNHVQIWVPEEPQAYGD